NGVYEYGASAFPVNTYNASNYWVDVVFSPTVAATAPTVVSTTPPAGATGVSPTTAVTAAFSEAIDPATVSTTTFTLAAGGTPVSGVVTGSGAAAQLTLSAPLARATTYTATIKGGPGGVADLLGHALAADVTWTFTTAAAGPDPALLGQWSSTITWPSVA